MENGIETGGGAKAEFRVGAPTRRIVLRYRMGASNGSRFVASIDGG